MDDEISNVNQTNTLSPREKEVLRCVIEGMTIDQIAARFARTPKAISTQKHNSYKKLGISSDSELLKLRNLIE